MDDACLTCLSFSDHRRISSGPVNYGRVVPRALDLAPELRGTGIFAFIKSSREEAVPSAELDAACRELRSALQKHV